MSFDSGKAKKSARKAAQRAQSEGLGNPIAALSAAGFRSEWAFVGGFLSIGLSLLSWSASRAKKDDRAQSDRWGIFIGHCAPTFFALGIALKLEEE